MQSSSVLWQGKYAQNLFILAIFVNFGIIAIGYLLFSKPQIGKYKFGESVGIDYRVNQTWSVFAVNSLNGYADYFAVILRCLE